MSLLVPLSRERRLFQLGRGPYDECFFSRNHKQQSKCVGKERDVRKCKHLNLNRTHTHTEYNQIGCPRNPLHERVWMENCCCAPLAEPHVKLAHLSPPTELLFCFLMCCLFLTPLTAVASLVRAAGEAVCAAPVAASVRANKRQCVRGAPAVPSPCWSTPMESFHCRSAYHTHRGWAEMNFYLALLLRPTHLHVGDVSFSLLSGYKYTSLLFYCSLLCKLLTSCLGYTSNYEFSCSSQLRLPRPARDLLYRSSNTCTAKGRTKVKVKVKVQ